MVRRSVATNLLAVACLASIALAGCGSEPVRSDPEVPFDVTAPTVAPLTADQIAALLNQLRDPCSHPPAEEFSASAFALNSPQPNTEDAEWQRFLTTYGDVRVIQLAIQYGWSLLVVGYTDASGSDATNKPLSEARADAGREALVSLGYRPDSITTQGAGVGGPDASNRKVVIQFVQPEARC
jgi:hypothetical protein